MVWYEGSAVSVSPASIWTIGAGIFIEIRDMMDKFKRILEGIYNWLFWLIILGMTLYFVILPEVGIDTKNISWESLDPFAGIKEKAYSEGYSSGVIDGEKAGKSEGYDEGYNAGYEVGFADGDEHYSGAYEDGYIDGYTKGYSEGKAAGTSSSAQSSGNSNSSGKSNGSGGGGGGNTYYGPVAEECDYVLNKSTKKFHKPSCSSATNIKPSNREYFTGTREAVIARGFEPCKRCNP